MFAAPLSRNPETVGALEAGSSIKTWVVRHSENTYYLTHSFDGGKSSAGAIFLDACCSVQPASRNLLLHGHNMYDGTAFGKLRDFRREDYLNVFPVIRFATRYEDAYYAIFAVFSFSVDEASKDYFDTDRFDFPSEADFFAYTDLARARSLLSIPVDVQAGDDLITLVTCGESGGDGRFAVMARKLRKGEAPDDYANPIDGSVRELRYKEEASFMRGPDVAEVQQALTTLGYFHDACDGAYGLGTAEAVRAFQSDHALTPDGIAGAETQEKLLAAANP
jgi:SrtB family sortase